MSDRADNQNLAQTRKLSDAIRDVKNAAADREDVVVELREATRTRLQLLAAELAPVFAEVPHDLDIFDFVISSGLQPRLWIDAVSHVAMGRDRRTYRFVKDTRNGRVVLAESVKMEPVADAVTRYVAERMVEREHLVEGDAHPAVEGARIASRADAANPARRDGRTIWRSILSGLGVVLAGVGLGFLVAAAVFWERLAAILNQ
jgi:hypothetical protein